VDDFHVHGREVYWLCRIRQSDSKFPAKKFEKTIGGPVTWRNMNTVVRLAAKEEERRQESGVNEKRRGQAKLPL
jgi:hypothetical protein